MTRITAAGTYSLAAGHRLVVVKAPGAVVVVKLPAVAAGLGYSVRVKRLAAAALTVATQAGEEATLEAGAGDALDVDGTGGDFSSDGVDWVLS